MMLMDNSSVCLCVSSSVVIEIRGVAVKDIYINFRQQDKVTCLALPVAGLARDA